MCKTEQCLQDSKLQHRLQSQRPYGPRNTERKQCLLNDKLREGSCVLGQHKLGDPSEDPEMGSMSSRNNIFLSV